ncbi:S8 family serine peptidase [Saccharicrinis sp. 156]|uniref:S8 family serine peptidase n=1 Tax=Saccharicrinis sp. 156 TaxID=3417574 RepID=UPI003D34E7E1
MEGCDINLFNAWLKQKGSQDVIVAVVDGGIDITHEDLADNIWINEDENNGGLVSDDDNNGYTDDIYGYNFVNNNGTIEPGDHGTHVAGTIGAVNGNSIGVCGIAGGDAGIPGVRLMSCQVFETDAMGNETSAENFAEAIKYAADNGAVICQNSWGYDDATYLPESMKDAIDYFIEYAGMDENGIQTGPMNGGVVIFASGNESTSIHSYPAMYDQVVSVAALSADYTMPYYSNYGSWVDITAPGGVDSSEDYYDNWIASTITDNKYAYLIGTSMACPHVSGVAALIVSEYGDQGFTPDMLKERLYYGAINVDGFNSSYQSMLGEGLINAAGTLSELNSTPPDVVTDLAASVSGNDVTLSWTVTGDAEDVKPTGYKIYYSKNPFPNSDISSTNSSLSSAVELVRLKNVGDQMSHTIYNLEYSSNYYFSIAGYDVLGTFSDYSESVLATTNENHPPEITSTSGNSFEVKAHENITFTCSINDPDQDSYSWSLIDTSGNITTNENDSEVKITINGLYADAGTYQASLLVEDEFGASSEFVFDYTILENHAPFVNTAIENTYIGDPNNSITIDLTEVFFDEDGEELEYDISYSSSFVTGSVSGDILTIAPQSNGLSTFEVTSSDARGENATSSFEVMVRDNSNEIDIYPNPVTDVINFRMGEDVDGYIEIAFYNDNAVMVKELSIPISTFSPAQGSISDMTTGQYLLKIKYNNLEFERNIVKL